MGREMFPRVGCFHGEATDPFAGIASLGYSRAPQMGVERACVLFQRSESRTRRFPFVKPVGESLWKRLTRFLASFHWGTAALRKWGMMHKTQGVALGS